MRKLAITIAVGSLLATAFVAAPAPVQAAGKSTVGTDKVVIVVGAVQGTTSFYRSYGDDAANTFAKYTSNVVKVYSPNATWENVQAAAKDAKVIVYLGHGSGYPNPYVGYLQPNGDNGMGLNYSTGSKAKSDSYTQYYGENYMAQLGLAPNAVVILWHLCYASGNNEPGYGAPTLDTAQTRVDGYASGFLRGNARAVIAEGVGEIDPYITAIFTAHETIDDAWRAAPNFHNHITSWDSTRNPGFTSAIDPDLAHPQPDGDPYYRSLVVQPDLTTDQIGVATPIPVPPASTYHPLAPARILDTRHGLGLAGVLHARQSQTFAVAGKGGVPKEAVAVTGNLTVTGQTFRGFVYLGPVATNAPTSSTINFPVGDNRANNVTVALAENGSLSVTYISSALGDYTTNVIFDVGGYFTADDGGATYHALEPARIVDTRHSLGLAASLTSRVAQTFKVTGQGGVPAGATAVTGNVTVTNQTSGGFVYVGPDAANAPTSSTLNFPVGDNRANGVTVTLGKGGTLSVTYIASVLGTYTTDVIFDVSGYFTDDATGASFHALTPARILDTRHGVGAVGVFFNRSARTFAVAGQWPVPADAIAVTGNLTVTGQRFRGYLYTGPVAMDEPTSSTLNFPIGDDRANGVTAALGDGGNLSVTYVASALGDSYYANVIFDVGGYYSVAAAPAK
jgi:hypothetical protein